MEQLGSGDLATGGREDTPRYPSISFGHTVGEFGGEYQKPPETLRKGRKCLLTPYRIYDDSEWDEVALVFVTYLEPRAVPEEWIEDQIISRVLELWRPFFPASEDVAEDEWRDEVQAAFDNAVKEMEAACERV